MVAFNERCVVSRAVLEEIATKEGITVQNPENPLSFCGLAARYFVDQGIYPPNDNLNGILIAVPKSDLSKYTFPHHETGNAITKLPSRFTGGFCTTDVLLEGMGSPKDYLTKFVYLPLSPQDLRGEERKYYCRSRNVGR